MQDQMIDTAVVPSDGPGLPARYYPPPPTAEVLQQAQERAKAVGAIVESQRLYQRIGPKKYVQVEGWNTLAASYGFVPDIEWTRPLEGGGFEARAVLKRVVDGFVIAHAEAQCGSKDDGKWAGDKQNSQRSMAQTRAVSKVCRLALSWVIVLAGFQATPAEEITDEMRKESRETRKSTGGVQALFDALCKAFPSDSDKRPNWGAAKRWLEVEAPEALAGGSTSLSKIAAEKQTALVAKLGGEGELPPEETPE